MTRDISKCNYITILGWMVSDLHLKGNELLIYALIHGFCQDGDGRFTGSLGYIKSWTGLSYPSVLSNLKSLVDKGFIEKTSAQVNGVTFCSYKTLDPINFFNRGSKETLDNIDIKRETKVSINNLPPTPKTKAFDFRSAMIDAGVDPSIAEAWLQVRKAKRAVNTELAWKATLSEIGKAGLPAADCIRIAAERSWAGFKAEWLHDNRQAQQRVRPKQGAVDRMLEQFNNYQTPIYDEQ